MKSQQGKIELQKKVQKRICVRDISLAARSPPYIIFCRFYSPECEQTFISCKTSLVLKKDKCLSVENILVLKFDKAILKT